MKNKFIKYGGICYTVAYTLKNGMVSPSAYHQRQQSGVIIEYFRQNSLLLK